MKQQIFGLAMLVMMCTVTAFKEEDCEGKLLLLLFHSIRFTAHSIYKYTIYEYITYNN